MSQRECSGFNWPPLSIPAEEPVSISPEAVSRAGHGVFIRTKVAKFAPLPPPRSDLGVATLAACDSVFFSTSFATGVGQPASATTRGNWSSRVRSDPSGFVPVVAMPGESFQSRADAVGQPASCAAIGRISPKPFPFPRSALTRSRRSSHAVPVLPLSIVDGVGQPVSPDPKSLSDVRRADARSAAIFRPDGVSRSFQVRAYKVEPPETVLGSDLLAEDDFRPGVLNEPVPVGP
jgi:hypothetical protein